MRGWVAPLAVLTVVAVGCLGVSGFSHVLRDDSLRNIGEVTSVVDAGDVVLIAVERRSSGWLTKSSWAVDDSGEAHSPDARTVAHSPQTQDCVGQVCYRVAGDALRVDVSEDGGGTYTVAWQIDGEEYQYLAATYPDVGDPAVHLSSRFVAVHPTGSGHVVFVANGRDGLLFRDAGGTWHRLGSPESGEGCCFYAAPLPLPPGPRLFDRVGWSVVGGVLLAVLGSAAVALRGRRPRRYGRLVLVVPIAAMSAYGAYLGWYLPDIGMFPGFFYGIPLILFALGTGVVLAFWSVRNNDARRAVRRAAAGSSPSSGPRVPG